MKMLVCEYVYCTMSCMGGGGENMTLYPWSLYLPPPPGKHGAATVITVTKVKNIGPERNTLTVSEKGELLHNNQDAMEYLEEEDDVTEEMASALCKKKTYPW